MKKPVFNKSGMKIINFQSEHKAFNKAINCPIRGNCVDSAYLSNYIRPSLETECNGFTNKEGDLFEFDIKHFEAYRVPKSIKALLKNNGGILYCLRIRTSTRNQYPIKFSVVGWIALSRDFSKVLCEEDFNRYKNRSVIEEFKRFIMEEGNGKS